MWALKIKRLTAKWHEGTFWDERYALYYYCDSGYTTTYILRHQIVHLWQMLMFAPNEKERN